MEIDFKDLRLSIPNKITINNLDFKDDTLVELKVKKSPLDGLGLFAKSFISKGTPIFKEEDLLEIPIKKEKAIEWLKLLPKKLCK